MKKKDELAEGSKGCFAKAGSEEMLFVLRAQDKTAPKVILHWIAKNFENTPNEKLREAFECAIEMKNHHSRKEPD